MMCEPRSRAWYIYWTGVFRHMHEQSPEIAASRSSTPLLRGSRLHYTTPLSSTT